MILAIEVNFLPYPVIILEGIIPFKQGGGMKTIYDPRYRNMIKWLIEARKKQGLSQEQVAVKLGVPRTRITKIESFDRRLDLLETLQLTRLYGLRLADMESVIK